MKKCSGRIQTAILSAAMCMALAGSMTAGAAESSVKDEDSVKTQASGTEAAAPSEEVTLNFWHHYSAQSPENETLMNDLIPKFEKENPGITVNAVSHEWADLHDKILISAQSDTLPDVARLDSAWVPEFQKMGILVPLNQEMSDFSDVSGGLLESAMTTAQIGGDSYALALNTNTKMRLRAHVWVGNSLCLP